MLVLFAVLLLLLLLLLLLVVVVVVVVVNWNINTDLYSCSAFTFNKSSLVWQNFNGFEYVQVLPYAISGTSVKWQ